MAEPTPIAAAQAAKRDADAAAAAANKASSTATAAAKSAAKAAEKAEKAAKGASGNPQKASALQEKAAAARKTADEKAADAKARRAEAEAANVAKAKADATLARLVNDQLKASLPAEEWDEIVDQIEQNCGHDAIKDNVVERCGKIYSRNCAGPTPDSAARMDQATQDAINTAHGTNVDFNTLAAWEGGQATQAYVPWFPLGVSVKDGAISADTTPVKGGTALAGSSRSGVTVGTGVDLGQQSPAVYGKRLRAAGVSEDLIAKLTPYMGLTRSEACRYLRAHPLTLTKAEADQIDKEMKSYHLAEAMGQYAKETAGIDKAPKFGELSPAEQTVLMSRKYQDGNLTNPNSSRLTQAMANRNGADAVNALSTQYYRGNAHSGRIPKEHDYLQASYPPPAPAAAPGKPPAGG